jgi:hypothetical protein
MRAHFCQLRDRHRHGAVRCVAPRTRSLRCGSRDANGTATDGHFSLRLGHDRRVVARIQRLSNPTVKAYRCTEQPVATDAWHRIEVSFGLTVTSVDGTAAPVTAVANTVELDQVVVWAVP